MGCGRRNTLWRMCVYIIRILARILWMEKDPQGRELASFECKAKSGGNSLHRSLLAHYKHHSCMALIVSQSKSNPDLVSSMLVSVAIISVIGALTGLLPGTRSICRVTEGGIRLRPVKARCGRGGFIKWRDLSRFSSKSLGLEGGRIYLYPRGPLSILRRVVIETLKLSDYQLLHDLVSSRVGML